MSESTNSKKVASKICMAEVDVRGIINNIPQHKPVRSQSVISQPEAWSKSDVAISASDRYTQSLAAKMIPTKQPETVVIDYPPQPFNPLQALTAITQQLISSASIYPYHISSHVPFSQHQISTNSYSKSTKDASPPPAEPSLAPFQMISHTSLLATKIHQLEEELKQIKQENLMNKRQNTKAARLKEENVSLKHSPSSASSQHSYTQTIDECSSSIWNEINRGVDIDKKVKSKLKKSARKNHRRSSTSSSSHQSITIIERRSPKTPTVNLTMSISDNIKKFAGTTKEAPGRFILEYQQKAKSTYGWDNETTLNSISHWLTDAAAEWYQQLIQSNELPKSWDAFVKFFLARFSSPERKEALKIQRN
ncbi:unnamed protein product, partial [Didymodactylos carnosus]